MSPQSVAVNKASVTDNGYIYQVHLVIFPSHAHTCTHRDQNEKLGWVKVILSV